MGRHRRSAAGRATTAAHAQGSDGVGAEPRHWSADGQAPRGIAPYLNPEAYAETNARAHAYLFADDDGLPVASAGGGFTPAGGPAAGRRHRGKAGRPVRAGLLGVSAAVALGTAAVATGVVPGLQNYQLGGSTHTTGGERPPAAGTPSNTVSEQGGTSGSADGHVSPAPAAGDTGRAGSPGPSASPATTSPPSASASASAPKPSSPTPAPSKPSASKPAPTAPRTTPSAPPKTAPPREATKAPAATQAPGTASNEAVAEAEVLALVNQERAKVGCSALAANSSLTGLASAFSDDMAARGFFDHTDPDGATPWDRAAKSGITDLGGENIARGQATAAAVMDAWMNSPGHRANILNCDFKTLGVGVHFGSGGPWWTQDFGY
ncbi:CAP domain-containing protein [Streptomyces sp. NPDC048362]|uniref:CAP domain-containing protein n=1 Tax=Streptomyces sp. NPDC048362 TaxID=3365539 RepID=UPI003716A901